MEYLIGGDLCSFLSYVGYIEEQDAVVYVAELSLAISYLHKHGIIHKDIKLENILIDKRGHIKLTDFGLSSIRLERKLTVKDLVNSPYNTYSPSHHWRTPGQILSLTTNFAFKQTKESNDKQEATPIMRRKKFVPKRCSYGAGSLSSVIAVNQDISSPVRPDSNLTDDDLSYFSDRQHSIFITPETSRHHLNKSLPVSCTKIRKLSNVSPMLSIDEDINKSTPKMEDITKREEGNEEVESKERVENNEGKKIDPKEQVGTQDQKMSLKERMDADTMEKIKEEKAVSSPLVITRVIGTPDYIAPELLLHKPHTTAADWWSVGICLYELIVGIPPFHDQTVPDIFKNILNMEIEWPETTTNSARDMIYQLLRYNPDARAVFQDIQKHQLFGDINWDKILDMEMPFVPSPESETDTGYFDGHNTVCNIKLSDFNGCISDCNDIDQ